MMNNQNNITNDLKFLTQSEIRLQILKELNKNPNNVKGLVENTKITYSTISINVGKLEKNDYIRKIKGKYYISPMTQVYYKTLIEFKNSLEIINEYNTFWNKHNVNQLSINSIKQITDLKDAKLVEATPIDIYKTHNIIKDQLSESKKVKAIFPYLHPDYPKLIENVLNKGGSFELILPETIFKELIFRINGPLRRKSMKSGKLKTFKLKNDINLYLTIGNETMSLGLFKNDGSFDQNRILISDHQKSYEWAEDLFKHVKAQVIK